MELYVHFPFCRQKCRYCNFVSFAGLEGRMETYMDALIREAELYLPELTEPVETVYFGGGTPSVVPVKMLERLIHGLKHLIPMDQVSEWTVEANPGTLTQDWLEKMRMEGISRVSMGMQAAQPRLLALLGRIHQPDQVQSSVRMLRASGFENISLDLMFGLPEQTRRDWEETLSFALSMKPKHISAYGLIPEEGTPLAAELLDGKLQLPEPEFERDLYDILLKTMTDHGFEQYEISNFALPGYACRHNIGYWDQVPYLGLGLSAASMVCLSGSKNGLTYQRRTNTASMDDYLSGIQAGHPVLEENERITPRESRFETMMLGLRMNRGVSEEEFLRRHGISMNAIYEEKLLRLEDQGLMMHDRQVWRLTRRGMDIQNSVLVELMED